jgi:hypothetical protein
VGGQGNLHGVWWLTQFGGDWGGGGDVPQGTRQLFCVFLVGEGRADAVAAIVAAGTCTCSPSACHSRRHETADDNYHTKH